MVAAGAYYDHKFYPGDLIGLVFLSEMLETDGDRTYGATLSDDYTGSVPAETDFVTLTTATLSTMMAEARAFWAAAPVGALAAADKIVGFSATTPREFFSAATSSAAQGTGAWDYSDGVSEISGANYAKALHALYELDGYSTQVSAIYEWLRAGASNSAFETSSDASDAQIANGATGTYDPTLAIATQIDSVTGKNASSYYDWTTAGLLSSIQASKDKPSMRRVKDALGKLYQRFHNGRSSDAVFDSIALRGQSGLTFQTSYYDSGTQRLQSGASAAQIGLVYRERPYETAAPREVGE